MSVEATEGVVSNTPELWFDPAGPSGRGLQSKGWRARFTSAHARVYAGQHLLSAVCAAVTGASTLSWHMPPAAFNRSVEDVSVTLDAERLPLEEVLCRQPLHCNLV